MALIGSRMETLVEYNVGFTREGVIQASRTHSCILYLQTCLCKPISQAGGPLFMGIGLMYNVGFMRVWVI